MDGASVPPRTEISPPSLANDTVAKLPRARSGSSITPDVPDTSITTPDRRSMAPVSRTLPPFRTLPARMPVGSSAMAATPRAVNCAAGATRSVVAEIEMAPAGASMLPLMTTVPLATCTAAVVLSASVMLPLTSVASVVPCPIVMTRGAVTVSDADLRDNRSGRSSTRTCPKSVNLLPDGADT